MTDKLEMYNFVGSSEELKWFFNHVVMRPKVWESYSFCLAVRNKKLTAEEKADLGFTSRQREFLQTEVLRGPRFKSAEELKTTYVNMVENLERELKAGNLNALTSLVGDKDKFNTLVKALERDTEARDKFVAEHPWRFRDFENTVLKFNIDKRVYRTETDKFLPEKCLVVLFYVNPANDMKVVDEVMNDIMALKTRVNVAVTNGKDWYKVANLYQEYSHMIDKVKHLKATCKGETYWVDYDSDLPAWFKESPKYMTQFKEVFNNYFGKGNYLLVNTGGGYHILVRASAHSANRVNPHKVCESVDELYNTAVKDDGMAAYDKYETIFNNNSIPGIPLPGTYQYGRLVTVDNKEDFE